MNKFLQLVMWPILKKVGTDVLIDVLLYAIRALEKDDSNEINKEDVANIEQKLAK